MSRPRIGDTVCLHTGKVMEVVDFTDDGEGVVLESEQGRTQITTRLARLFVVDYDDGVWAQTKQEHYP